jgi:hypothetical protein
VSQQRPRQRLVAKSARNQRVMRGQRQRSPGRTGLSGVPSDCPVFQGDPSYNGRLCQIRKEITHCSCPVRPRTEGNYCLPNGAPMASSCLGAIKGTPRCMEQYTKPPLNILRRLDSANTHLIHCLRDLSTF